MIYAAFINTDIAASLAASQALSSSVFGISTTDPPTLTAVALLLAVVASLACGVPARRAARVNPTVALHQE